MASEKLTAKQEAFCKAIVAGGTQADAYRSVYSAARMKAKQVHEEASKLMASPKIAQRVSDLASAVDREFTISTADLVRESARVAFSDISKIMGPDGRMKLPTELDEDTRRAVSSFKIDDLGRIEYKFWDKNSAHERLFKFKGMFEKDNSQRVDALGELISALQGNVVGPVESAATFGPGMADEEDA